MKECPICHKQYDDSFSFCIKDGKQLNPVGGFEKPTNQGGNKPRKNWMKKIALGIFVIIVGLILLNNYLKNATTYLRLEPNVIQATKAGEVCKVGIDYDGYVWTVNHQPEWVHLHEGENYLDLSIDANMTGQIREGSITVQSGKQLAQLVIRQNAFATKMKLSEASIHFGKDGGVKEIMFDTDGCDAIAEFPEWMQVRYDIFNKIVIECPGNEGEYRRGSVVLKEDYVRAVIIVSQGGICSVCKGSREVLCNVCKGMPKMNLDFGFYYRDCGWCGGDGLVKCKTCEGTGYIE